MRNWLYRDDEGVAMKKRGIQVFSIFLLSWFLLFIPGCEKEVPTAKKDKLHKVIAVGSQWYGHIPVWVGIEKGIFEKHG